jgi:hypothetical protein
VALRPSSVLNPQGLPREFRVELEDAAGHTSSVSIAEAYAAPRPFPLFYPPGSPPSYGSVVPVPHTVLTTVRMPIRLFQQNSLALKGIVGVTFKFDTPNNSNGALVMTDIGLTNSECTTPAPSGTCPVFQDVVTGDPLKYYIDTLACHTFQYVYVMSGYVCGSSGEPCVCPERYPYFRPYNTITRGQLSKIVALSAQFPEDPTGQTFEDVPAGSPFYKWVQQMANRGYVSGYLCGGSGEPCVPPSNRPYFRPNAQITRGAIAKIVSNSAGFNDPVSGQRFEDVPPGSPFYEYAERLASRDILLGYPCGGPSEPCVPPNNRPYFRPGAYATRGQGAKIVLLSFFPNEAPGPGQIPAALPTGAPQEIPSPVPTP